MAIGASCPLWRSWSRPRGSPEAVEQDGPALTSVAEELKRDQEIVQKAAKQDGLALSIRADGAPYASTTSTTAQAIRATT